MDEIRAQPGFKVYPGSLLSGVDNKIAM